MFYSDLTQIYFLKTVFQEPESHSHSLIVAFFLGKYWLGAHGAMDDKQNKQNFSA